MKNNKYNRKYNWKKQWRLVQCKKMGAVLIFGIDPFMPRLPKRNKIYNLTINWILIVSELRVTKSDRWSRISSEMLI